MELELVPQKVHQKRWQEKNNFRIYKFDNAIKVKYSLPILRQCGQVYSVQRPARKKELRKSGSCYPSSIAIAKKLGYGYVEGIMTDKEEGVQISHAWNVDSNGIHIDFTNDTPEQYEYKGIVIPFDLLKDISELNGKLWYCALPFLKVKQTKQE